MKTHAIAATLDRQLRQSMRQPVAVSLFTLTVSLIVFVAATVAQVRALPTPTVALPLMLTALVLITFFAGALIHPPGRLGFDGGCVTPDLVIHRVVNLTFAVGAVTAVSWAVVGAFGHWADSYRAWMGAVVVGAVVSSGWIRYRNSRLTITFADSGLVVGGSQKGYHPWDGITAEAGVAQLPANLPVEISDLDGNTTTLLTSGMNPSMWQLIWTIEHFRDHPEDRAILGTPEGPAFVQKLINYPVDKRLWPRWFRPPPAAWADESPQQHPESNS